METNFYVAIALTDVLHSNDKRHDGSPYVTHVHHVVNAVSDPVHKTIAAFHDSVEMGHTTLKEIGKKFGPRVQNGVDSLTRRDAETYFDYIRRLKLNPDAVVVKVADLNHNQPTAPESMKKRYAKAKEILQIPSFDVSRT